MKKIIKTGKQILSPLNLKMIFWAGLISGTLDAIASSSIFYFKLGLHPGQVMQFVASAIFGPEAFKGGLPMVITGTVAHYLISFAFAGFYFLIFPYLKITRSNPMGAGILYGGFIWMFMNLGVMPLSAVQAPPFELIGVLVSIICHMILVGLPISLIAKRQDESVHS